MLLERIFFFLLFFAKNCLCDNQTVFTLNEKKSLHVVSDKFLSVSVDPAVLLSGLNISGTSLLLTRHLYPAYIRIAGPSTEFLQFTEDEQGTTYQISDETLSLTVTPSQWDSLNEWFINTNLVPVFTINGRDGLNGNVDPKTIFFLLGLSEKINVSCFWQLGYDSSKKQVIQYLEEIKLMRNALNALPSEAKTWKIAGGDLNALHHTSLESLNQILEALGEVAHSVMWESIQDEGSFLQDDLMTNLLSAPAKPKLSVWTTVPKNKQAISFASGILWAKQIGNAANKGFGVVFRQPRLYEFFTDTPVYWISVLHKKLMGNIVLDVKANDNRQVGINLYAHCTRKQNNFSRRGAVTIFVVNNESTEHTVVLQILGITQLKTMEVQVYTLTSDDQDSANTYLNGQKLTRVMLQDNQIVLTPKIRRAKINKYLTFDVPHESVNFFVLPDARVPVCINSEDETNLLIEEIRADQKINFPSDVPTNISFRFKEEEEEEEKENVARVTLSQLYNEMQKELEVDEKYYDEVSKHIEEECDRKHQNSSDLNLDEMTLKDVDKKNNSKGSTEIFDSNVGYNLLKMKIVEKKSEFLRKLGENSKLFQNDANKLKITRNNPNVILKQNRGAQLNSAAENNINLTSEELEEIILTATKIIKGENFGAPISKRDCKGGGRGGHGRGRGSKGHYKQTQVIAKPTTPKPNPKPKPKRAINMELLREKAGDSYMIGKVEASPNKQIEKIKGRETDFASEIKRQRDKIKADLEKLLHPKETESKQKVQALSFNSVEEASKEKRDFAAEAKKQYDKMRLDLAKILHPKTIKNEQKLQTHVLDSEEDYFDQSNDFDSFGDDDDNDVRGYEKFDEEFKLGAPMKQNVNKGLWEERFHGKIKNDRKLEDGANSFLGKEFVVENKDPRVIEKTIKNLEDYFNGAQNRRYELDDDISAEYDSDYVDDFNYQEPTRFKRDDKHYTEADIRYYRQLMNHNIKHMRDSIRKQQRANIKLKMSASPIQKMKPKYVTADKVPKPVLSPNLSKSLKTRTNVDHFKSPGVYDLKHNASNTANIENKKTENSVKYLKNRLANHKRMEDVQGGMRLRSAVPEVNEETQRLVNLIKSELRNRKPRSASHQPKADPSNLLWKEEKVCDKEDIMKSRKIRPFEMIADSAQVVPVVNGSLKKVRVKRFIDINGNYLENDSSDKGKKVENIWASKVATGICKEVEEAQFCNRNDVKKDANVSIDFHKDSMESISKVKGEEANHNFVDDVFLFFSKLLYKIFTNA